MTISEEQAWLKQCRRQLESDVMTRIKYGFCRVYKPGLDDVDVRVFATMKEYRAWCEESLPTYLGYRTAANS